QQSAYLARFWRQRGRRRDASHARDGSRIDACDRSTRESNARAFLEQTTTRSGLNRHGADAAVYVGHLLDTERVFAYRLLRISRGDTTELHGFDGRAPLEWCRIAGRSAARRGA